MTEVYALQEKHNRENKEYCFLDNGSPVIHITHPEGKRAVKINSKVYSSSELETGKVCRRKWNFRYVEKIKSKPNKYAEAGSKLHAELEDYYKNQKTVTSSVLIEVIDHFPFPEPHIEVEEPFAFKAVLDNGDTIIFWGFIDVADSKNELICDLKTTGDLKWAKSEKYLATEDFQSTLYGIAGCLKWSTDSVTNRWVYTRRTPSNPAGLAVEIKLSLQQLIANLEKFVPLAKDLVQLYPLKQSSLTVTPNPQGCGMFGGCDYRELCTDLTPTNQLKSLFAQDKERKQKDINVSVLDKLKAKNKTNNVVDRLREKIPDAEQAEKLAQPVEVPVQKNKIAALSEKITTAINPPEEPAPEPESETAPDMSEKKRRPGRPRGSTKTPAAPVQKSDTMSSPSETFTLYLDVDVRGLEVEEVRPHLDKLIKELEAEFELAHYRLMEYNKGPATLAAGVRTYFADKTGAYKANREELDREVLLELLSRADVIVQGR